MLVIGEDRHAFLACTFVKPPHGAHVVHERMLHPVLSSLLELVHVDTVESFARRLRTRGRHHADTLATPAQPYGGRAPRTRRQTSAITVTRGCPIDLRVLPITRDKAGVRQRSFTEAVATLPKTCWEGWPITGPWTFLWCARFILSHCTSPQARHYRWPVET